MKQSGLFRFSSLEFQYILTRMSNLSNVISNLPKVTYCSVIL